MLTGKTELLVTILYRLILSFPISGCESPLCVSGMSPVVAPGSSGRKIQGVAIRMFALELKGTGGALSEKTAVVCRFILAE